MELTPAQKQLILDTWNATPDAPPSLKTLVELIFGEGVDGRDIRGKLIKQFLATRNFRAKATSDKENKTSLITLTEEMKLYIANNANNNTALEMARELFHNEHLTNLNAETRIVNEYLKSLTGQVIFGGKEAINDVPEGEYEPPKTLDKALKKINEYVSFVRAISELNAQQKKNTEKLIDYLHTYRFIRLMNSFESQKDRKSCEDAFIRYTYDKSDLTQEEIDQYISLVGEVVHELTVKRRMEKMGKQQESISDNTEESQKYSMGLVEAIGKASTEFHQCRDRQRKLLDALTEKRSGRLNSQINENASILNLVQMWRDEEGRKELLKIAQLEQQSITEEVDRISSVSEIKLKILGLSKSQIING
jgi:hypothetical protein